MSDENGTEAVGRMPASCPSPLDLAAFLPYAGAQLQLPFSIQIEIIIQEEFARRPDEKSGKRTSLTLKSRAVVPAGDSRSGSLPAEPTPLDAWRDPGALRLALVRDSVGADVELDLRDLAVPCQLLALLALCLPLHPQLTRLTLQRVIIAPASVYQLSRLLLVSHLTDLCLDDSPTRPGLYRELLAPERPSRLRRLSLARCRLEPADAEWFAAALHHPLPASRSLRLLSLASNPVGDAAALALAAALRSNRTLQYLNLADTGVTDEGATALLSAFAEFRLTIDEVIAKRRRFVEYHRLRADVHARFLAELRSARSERGGGGEPGGAARRRTRRTPGSAMTVGGGGPGELEARAAAMAEEAVGAYREPFDAEETATRDDEVYSAGNTALCWLNLAHNGLGAPAAGVLRRVLEHQAELAARRGAVGPGAPPGLLRVVLEGNPLPAPCAALDAVCLCVERAVERAGTRIAPRRADRSVKSKTTSTR